MISDSTTARNTRQMNDYKESLPGEREFPTLSDFFPTKKVLIVFSLELGSLAGCPMAFPFPWFYFQCRLPPALPPPFSPTLTPEEEQAEAPHGPVFLSLKKGTLPSFSVFSVTEGMGREEGWSQNCSTLPEQDSPFC